jgi:hypothetical protein
LFQKKEEHFKKQKEKEERTEQSGAALLIQVSRIYKSAAAAAAIITGITTPPLPGINPRPALLALIIRPLINRTYCPEPKAVMSSINQTARPSPLHLGLLVVAAGRLMTIRG